MNYNKLIDHTILRADATEQDVKKICQEARELDFASVCVNGCFVPLVAQELAGSSVKVCTVIGFPLGAMSTTSKVQETRNAVKDGADEIDMVINIGDLKTGKNQKVEDEIRAIKVATDGHLLKVIIETALLTNEEKVRACKLAVAAGADFVKTSTGFSKGGATVEDVRLMRETVGPNIGVKASGGVKTHEDLLAMVKAGASRIGTSSGPSII
ncbi:MAG: deoxyribose-phosphate aldolase [Bacilli bacterium]|jgi:deoxyribose-phosphate aldolase|nr:deoxyribose-phosphate aldolase [Bacilli bacterium]MDD3388875.1 deoxyribose-phosphate aldolase [Bacilli bacterium]MDD4344671.1 deoxyribose-phosphate aldolase [Bacilli bacterium]MDD4520555.1 deoxyribose-phosphate aldolase [Bacilli bacterium]MDY0399247.1 deoxyribose-phosphate aldolase [Bacilli bacterium]